MKRKDWLANKSVLLEGGPAKSEVWSSVADDIVSILFSINRFTKVCKADRSSMRLMLGAAFFDVQIHGMQKTPRPNIIFNIIGTVTEFTEKQTKVKIQCLNAAVAYEFTYRAGKLTRKQIS